MGEFAIEIDMALFFTFVITVFAGLQWLAVLKQNDQNLFELRVQHYKKFYEICGNLIIRLEHHSTEHKIIEVEVEELEKLSFELDNYIDESKFLFSEELYQHERIFTNNANKLIKKIYGSEEIMQTEIDNLKTIYFDSKKLIEKFLYKYKP